MIIDSFETVTKKKTKRERERTSNIRNEGWVLIGFMISIQKVTIVAKQTITLPLNLLLKANNYS